MIEPITFYIFFISLYFIISLLWKASVRNKYNQSKHKISDVAVFELIAKTDKTITVKQLVEASNLTRSEASNRLSYLAMERTVGIHCLESISMVYKLSNELPEGHILPIDIEGLRDVEIIDILMKYSHDYHITIPEVVLVFGIDIERAKQILKRLKKNGLVKRQWPRTASTYVVKDPSMKAKSKLEMSTSTDKIELPKNQKLQEEQVKLRIPDADVLHLAIEHKGRLTPTVLCLKLNISMEEAQLKLDDLYEQGVFIMDIDEKNALVEYHLRDKSLLV